MTDRYDIQEFIAEYERMQHGLRKSIYDILYYMKGSIQRSEAWALSFRERKEMFEYIDERFKIAQKLNK